MNDPLVTTKRKPMKYLTSVDDFSKWQEDLFDEVMNEQKKDYQMSLIELDHKFSLDLLKW